MVPQLSAKFQLNQPIKTRNNWKTSFGSDVLSPFSKNGYNFRTENAMDTKSSLKEALIVLQLTVRYEENLTTQTQENQKTENWDFFRFRCSDSILRVMGSR